MPQPQNVEQRFETDIYIHLRSDRKVIPAFCKAKSGFFNNLIQDFAVFIIYYLVVTTAAIWIQTSVKSFPETQIHT